MASLVGEFNRPSSSLDDLIIVAKVHAATQPESVRLELVGLS